MKELFGLAIIKDVESDGLLKGESVYIISSFPKMFMAVETNQEEGGLFSQITSVSIKAPPNWYKPSSPIHFSTFSGAWTRQFCFKEQVGTSAFLSVSIGLRSWK